MRRTRSQHTASDINPVTHGPWRYYWFAFSVWTLLILLSWRLAPRSPVFEALGENWAASLLLIGAIVPKQAFKALLALTFCGPLLLLIHAQIFALVASQGPAPTHYQIAALAVPLVYGLTYHWLTSRVRIQRGPPGPDSDCAG